MSKAHNIDAICQGARKLDEIDYKAFTAILGFIAFGLFLISHVIGLSVADMLCPGVDCPEGGGPLTNHFQAVAEHVIFVCVVGSAGCGFLALVSHERGVSLNG